MYDSLSLAATGAVCSPCPRPRSLKENFESGREALGHRPSSVHMETYLTSSPSVQAHALTEGSSARVQRSTSLISPLSLTKTKCSVASPLFLLAPFDSDRSDALHYHASESPAERRLLVRIPTRTGIDPPHVFCGSLFG